MDESRSVLIQICPSISVGSPLPSQVNLTQRVRARKHSNEIKKAPRARLTNHEIELIREMLVSGMNYRQVAARIETPRRQMNGDHCLSYLMASGWSKTRATLAPHFPRISCRYSHSGLSKSLRLASSHCERSTSSLVLTNSAFAAVMS